MYAAFILDGALYFVLYRGVGTEFNSIMPPVFWLKDRENLD